MEQKLGSWGGLVEVTLIIRLMRLRYRLVSNGCQGLLEQQRVAEVAQLKWPALCTYIITVITGLTETTQGKRRADKATRGLGATLNQ